MLMLVMANNFLQLFLRLGSRGAGFLPADRILVHAADGHLREPEGVSRERVGDFGFLLGIALVLMYFGTLDYASVFANARTLAGNTIEMFSGSTWSLMTVICICFRRRHGKIRAVSAARLAARLHGRPDPISALIHAATMVTAGIFMVARMSPLFELSDTALTVVMVIGAITAFFMALIATVVYDIKRVIAYSTLSQLGYMTVALGASAYSVAIFHLMTHAFFKAVLFLGAGSVIIALHHEQDMRKMGGVRKYMPITYLTMLIGASPTPAFPRLRASSPRIRSSRRRTLRTCPAPGSRTCARCWACSSAASTRSGSCSTLPRQGAFNDPHHPDVKEVEAERRPRRADGASELRAQAQAAMAPRQRAEASARAAHDEHAPRAGARAWPRAARDLLRS
jgi:hypothetical protein